MDHHHSQPVPVDPQELERARAMWKNFTSVFKFHIYGIIALLILMAIFLL